jgi:Zn-dependent M28 family amino/carboxypeptidase
MKQYLEHSVKQLSVAGLRNATGPKWDMAMDLMATLIKETGHCPKVEEWKASDNRIFRNFHLGFQGKEKKKIILGAHYDTFENTPGADDNASAVAVLLGVLKNINPGFIGNYPLEVIFYACEEPPYFGTDGMGSFVDAQKRNPDEIELMLCFEMVGYFSDEKNSQDYPFTPFRWLYGSTGNFLLAVGNINSLSAARKFIQRLQRIRPNFYRKLILPFSVAGMDWSDHRSYWAKGIPAIMLTDTAAFRNKNYHTLEDTPEKLDYEKMAGLVQDICSVFCS